MVYVFLGAICIGFAPIFVKLVTLGPSMIGVYRCGLAAFFLALFINSFRKSGQPRLNPLKWSRQIWTYTVGAGFFFAADLFVWHRSLIFCGAGMGTILANTQVFYVSLFAIAVHKEKITVRFVAAVLLAFLGIYLLAGFQAPGQKGENYWAGVWLGLATGVFYAGYILSMRKLEQVKGKIPTEQFVCLVSAVAALFLLVIAVGEGEFRLPFPGEWPWLLALALVTHVAGWLLITRNLPRVPVSSASLILITQPVVATVGGTLVFGERLTLIQVAGAFLSLLSIYLGSSLKVPRLGKRK